MVVSTTAEWPRTIASITVIAVWKIKVLPAHLLELFDAVFSVAWFADTFSLPDQDLVRTDDDTSRMFCATARAFRRDRRKDKSLGVSSLSGVSSTCGESVVTFTCNLSSNSLRYGELEPRN